MIEGPRFSVAILSYGIIATLLSLTTWIVIPQEELPIPFILLLLFLGFLLFARVWTIGLLLLLFLTVLILNEPPAYDAPISFESLIISCMVLLVVIAASRYYMLSAPLIKISKRSRDRTKKRKFLSWENWKRPIVPKVIESRSSDHFSNYELFTGLLRGLFPLAISMVLLWLVPLDRSSVQNFRLTPGGLRAIGLSLSLFCVVVITNGLLNIFVWKKLSASETRIYLHSILGQFLLSETRMVIQRKIKDRRRNSLNNQLQ